MSSKIVLDKDSFKALASDTRIVLLKCLRKRRYMLTELSHMLDLKHPTVKEHLNALAKAGLVQRHDEGRKWKYYSLTEKGRVVLDPERKTIWVLLAFTLFSAGALTVRLGSRLFSFGSSSMALKSAVPLASEIGRENLPADQFANDVIQEGVRGGGEITREVARQGILSDPTTVMLLLATLVLVGLLLWYWCKRKKSF